MSSRYVCIMVAHAFITARTCAFVLFSVPTLGYSNILLVVRSSGHSILVALLVLVPGIPGWSTFIA